MAPSGPLPGKLGFPQAGLGGPEPSLEFPASQQGWGPGEVECGTWVQKTDLRRRSSESPCEVCKARKEKDQRVHCQEGTALPSPGLKAQGAWLACCPWCQALAALQQDSGATWPLQSCLGILITVIKDASCHCSPVSYSRPFRVEHLSLSPSAWLLTLSPAPPGLTVPWGFWTPQVPPPQLDGQGFRQHLWPHHHPRPIHPGHEVRSWAETTVTG